MTGPHRRRLLAVLLATLLAVAAALAPAAPATSGEPVQVEVRVAGPPAVGTTLTVTAVADRPGTFSYTWTRAYTHTGVPLDIHGAHRRTFTPTAYFRGKILGVRVTHTGSDGRETRTFHSIGKVRPGTLDDIRVTLTGEVRPDGVLRAQVRHAADQPLGWRLSYDWYADGRRVRVNGSPATSRRLHLSPAVLEGYRGTRLRVAASAAAPGYLRERAVSSPTRRLQP